MYHTLVTIVLVLGAIWSALGSPLPRLEKLAAWFAPVDRWIAERAKHPRIFYLFSGLLVGFLLVPHALLTIRYFVEKRAEFTITPEFLFGFGGPSTTGLSYSVEWVTIVIRLGNTGSAASSADHWTATLRQQDGKSYQGLIKEIFAPVCLMSAKGTPFWIPPSGALYQLSQTPLEPGAFVTGVLQFELAGLPAAPLSPFDKLTISVREIHGETTSRTVALADIVKDGPQIIAMIKDVHEETCPVGR